MKTQEQHYYDSVRNSADANDTFLELLRSENPITANDLHRNIQRRPELWGRFAVYLPLLEKRESEVNREITVGITL